MQAIRVNRIGLVSAMNGLMLETWLKLLNTPLDLIIEINSAGVVERVKQLFIYTLHWDCNGIWTHFPHTFTWNSVLWEEVSFETTILNATSHALCFQCNEPFSFILMTNELHPIGSMVQPQPGDMFWQRWIISGGVSDSYISIFNLPDVQCSGLTQMDLIL